MDLLDILSKGGQPVVILILGWLVIKLDAERRDLQKELRDQVYAGKESLLRQTLDALNANSNVLNSWRELITSRRDQK